MTQFSNTIGETSYAKKASQYINILNDLRRIGAHSAVDLPTVVFCGNQSAGKSSLLEAISNVQLPRSEGTCTRCVMELRLIESDVEWSCQISLRQEYDESGRRLSQPIEEKFASLIKSHKEVELMARRAQKALLNPSKNCDDYLNWNFGAHYDDDANNELKFTKNVVCLEIKGKNVPNLSLIDLPGIIHHTEKAEDRKFIDLIKELVKEYIKKEQSIIIATITCRDEIDNQAIVTLAKEADPAGRRTLGVLTKPDTIERGTHDIWLKILRGEAHKLSLGYYVFFESRDPWKDFMSDRIGVKKLRHKLSELLIQAIKRDLPKISKDAEEKLDEAYETSALSGRHELWQMINKKFIEFNNNLFLSRPIFVIVITEQQITELIINARGRLLPGFIPYSSAMTIIKDTQIEWKSPSLECLDGIYEIMFEFLHEEVINEIFSRFPLLDAEMNLKLCFREKLYEILQDEGSQPTDSIDIIASLLAYFKIAFKRYADTIAMTIIHAFIDEFTKRIEEKLIEICVSDDEQFDIGELIQEDYTVSFHRDDLRTRENHLKNVLDSLRKFQIIRK
ncbi:7610_t:CDS:2 [Diversispora eburnea]|uniref:7610_t:CDS:1 n=1 Tax=Diversispora eburnea TaxID=1213867 RepID=A0A9N8ZQ30_9GLOM|nr:7610_t:CDS:2 [Diversispora eburnea]